jgi:single-strand DNA-binding protein
MPFPRMDIELVGNVGKAPEMRYTPDAKQVVKLSLGVSRKWKADGGEQKQETSWFTVTCWGQLAEQVNRLAVGQQVLVKGYLKPDPTTGCPRIWTRADGTPGASYELTATEVWVSLFGKASGSTAVQPESAEYGDEPPPEIPF